MWSESKPEGLGSGFFSEDWIRVISTRNPAKKKVCPPIQKMLKNRERECHGIYSRWFIQNMFTVITKGHIFELFNTLNIRALQTELGSFWHGVWWYDPTLHHTNTTVHIHSHKIILACN